MTQFDPPSLNRTGYASRDSPPSHTLLDQKLDARVLHMFIKCNSNVTPPLLQITDQSPTSKSQDAFSGFY